MTDRESIAERDPTVAPIAVMEAGRPTLRYAYRRKVFTFWRDDSGKRWGRWHWERWI